MIERVGDIFDSLKNRNLQKLYHVITLGDIHLRTTQCNSGRYPIDQLPPVPADKSMNLSIGFSTRLVDKTVIMLAERSTHHSFDRGAQRIYGISKKIKMILKFSIHSKCIIIII